MYCTRCGQKLFDTARFCDRCGAPTRLEEPPQAPPPPVPEPPPYVPPAGLCRLIACKRIAGVCAGFARYFGVDVTLMRILWIAMALFSGGLAIPLYGVAWLLMPADYTPRYAA